jgi:apolipoprotein N-acyltransferase
MGSAPRRWPPAKAESLRLVAKAGGATVSASRPDFLAGKGPAASSNRTPRSPSHSSGLTVWAENFLFAGSSALLLLIAGLRQDHWYLSFFALTPFLYRILRGTPDESLRLGLLFGISFFGASSIPSLFISPAAALVRLFGGTALFALFGWTVGQARKRWGFSPSIVAVLWVALGIGLTKFGLTGGFLGEAGFSHPFLHSLAGLLGFLAVSAIIVFLNSLLVLAIVRTLEAARRWGNQSARNKRTWNLSFTRNLFAEKVYLVPEGRAPPIMTETVCPRIEP